MSEPYLALIEAFTADAKSRGMTGSGVDSYALGTACYMLGCMVEGATNGKKWARKEVKMQIAQGRHQLAKKAAAASAVIEVEPKAELRGGASFCAVPLE